MNLQPIPLPCCDHWTIVRTRDPKVLTPVGATVMRTMAREEHQLLGKVYVGNRTVEYGTPGSYVTCITHVYDWDIQALRVWSHPEYVHQLWGVAPELHRFRVTYPGRGPMRGRRYSMEIVAKLTEEEWTHIQALPRWDLDAIVAPGQVKWRRKDERA